MSTQAVTPRRLSFLIAPVCLAGLGILIAAAYEFATTAHSVRTLVSLAALTAAATLAERFPVPINAEGSGAFPTPAELAAALRDPAGAPTVPLARPKAQPRHRRLAYGFLGVLLVASIAWGGVAAQRAQVPEAITHTTRVPARLAPPAAATAPAAEARALAAWIRAQAAR